MKRFILTAVIAIATTMALNAQNYIVVNSEKIFKSINDYNSAIEQLDKLAENYQKQVDEKFSQIEKLYNNYMAQRSSLSASVQQSVENEILSREEEATKFQESLFGSEGTLMKERVKLIQPIQEKVFAAIESYASSHGFDLVIDIASNPTVLYHSSKADHTQAIIEALK